MNVRVNLHEHIYSNSKYHVMCKILIIELKRGDQSWGSYYTIPYTRFEQKKKLSINSNKSEFHEISNRVTKIE